jgi:hypothetical protein
MNASTQVANGRPQRKLLSEQLDRLDSIIDALAEGLPEAIAAAAREGTREAVKEAIVEVLANPELRAFFQHPMASASVPNGDVIPQPSLWCRIKANLAAAKTAVVERIHAVQRAAGRTFRQIAALPLAGLVITTVTVGLAAGAAAYLAPAIGVSSMVASIGGALAAAAAQAGAWLRRSARTLLATS